METTGFLPVVSMVKGIAIILVVTGHSLPYDNGFRNYIYMFHVPLFFFVSGYCFKEKYLDDVLTFVRQRVKGLWLPFVKYGVPMVLLHNVFCRLHVYGPLCDVAPYTLPQMVKAVLKQFVMSGAEPMLGAYWFLNTLFGASLLFYACRRWTGAKWGLAILTAGTAVSLLLVPYADAVRIVFRMFFAGAYMTLGHLFAEMSFGTKGVRGMAVIAALGTMVGVGAVFLPHEMTDATLPTMLPCMAVAVAGILMLWGICQWLLSMSSRLVTGLSAMLEYIGNRTLKVLTWHFLCFKVVTLLIILLYGLPIEHLSALPVLEEQAAEGWWVVYVLSGVMVVCLNENHVPMIHRIMNKK